jgi:hypothetical protein
VDARPLIVGQGGKPSAVPISPATTNASAAEGGIAGEENGVEVKRPDKAYLIANELLTTERHYVSRLHLIDQVCKNFNFCFLTFMLFVYAMSIYNGQLFTMYGIRWIIRGLCG